MSRQCGLIYGDPLPATGRGLAYDYDDNCLEASQKEWLDHPHGRDLLRFLDGGVGPTG